MGRRTKAQIAADEAKAAEAKAAEETQVEDETPEETEDEVEGAASACCDRHPECDADKCRCFSKCLASVCECDGASGKSYPDEAPADDEPTE